MKRKIVLTGIIRCNDEYLIVKRSKDDDFLPGVWEFPGGNIEDGELILDALKREIYEEIEPASYKEEQAFDYFTSIEFKTGDTNRKNGDLFKVFVEF